VEESSTEFGAVLRKRRRARKLTLRDLASLTGSHYTHLSRLETGREQVASRELMNRLGSELGAEAAAELAAAAGRLTPVAEKSVSAFPRALVDPALAERTVPALRRIELAAKAERIVARTRGAIVGNRVDPSALCRAVGLRPQIVPGDPALTFDDRDVRIAEPAGLEDPARAARVRYLMAHAAAHAHQDSRSCSYPRMSNGEPEAHDLCVHLLCPRGLLERSFREVLSEYPDLSDPWAPGTGNLVSAVAERLSVPAWVALRRLADQSLLDDEALYYYPET
jgi:transcriptional regulator with XRE-family HTH domain